MQNKKVILIAGGAIFVISVAAIIIGLFSVHEKLGRYEFGYQNGMMNRSGAAIALPNFASEKNRFVVPGDGAKNGELAIVVNDLDSAKQKIQDIAIQSGGRIYATYIAYASSDLKNGSIVIQMPRENFEKVFADLKKSGFQVIEESTQEIETRTFYPMATPAANVQEAADTVGAESGANGAAATSTVSPSEPQGAIEPQIAIYPQPQNFAQNKGYIRVVMAVSGAARIGSIVRNDGSIENQYFAKGTSKHLLAGLFLKVLMLVVLVGLLIFMLKKIFHAFHLHREYRRQKRAEKRSVKQLSATRSRVVRIAKRK
jgi:uncharacterized membrane protein